MQARYQQEWGDLSARYKARCGSLVKIAIFEGTRRLYSLEVAHDTLADMQTEVATAGTTVAGQVDFVIADLSGRCMRGCCASSSPTPRASAA